MNFFNATKKAAAMLGVAVGVIFAQGVDTAYVPFRVNVDANILAELKNGATVTASVQGSVTAGEDVVLALPLLKTIGVLHYAQGRQNAPAIISNRNGKITLNLSAQSYKNAEVSLYTVNGKRILRNKASASNTVNAIIRHNVVPGVYLLSVRGGDGAALTSRLTHGGGKLDIDVSFGSGSFTSNTQLAKATAAGDWTISVSATGYVDSVYTLRPVAGSNLRQDITLARTGTYKVTVSSIGANSSGGGGYLPGETVTISAGTPSIGYQFVRWTTSSNGVTFDGSRNEITTFTMPANAVTVTANYEAMAGYYSITVDVNPERGAVSLDPAPLYVSGTEVTVTAIAAVNYRFANWTGASTGSSNPVTIIVDGNKTLSAYFTFRGDSGTFTDSRDNKVYKTILMPDKKTWMAENLNYAASIGSWCYENDGSYCTEYGRLYDWAAAMNLDSSYNNKSFEYKSVNEVCPYGWHLPSGDEWSGLAKAAGGTNFYGEDGTAGTNLKSETGWNSASGTPVGRDTYGFSALPGGSRSYDGYFRGAGTSSCWWTSWEASEQKNYNAFYRCMNNDRENVNVIYTGSKKNGISVRCVRN